MKSHAADSVSVGERVHSRCRTAGRWTHQNAEDNIYCAGLANVAKLVVRKVVRVSLVLIAVVLR